jgi:predicted nucleic acid-binding protein
LTIDLAAALRRVKPERRADRLRPRTPSELIDVADIAGGRFTAVLDTCVYIDDAADRLPAAAERLIDSGILFHCAVSLGEIAVGLGHLSPQSPRYRTVRAYYRDLLKRVPAQRVLIPDADTWVQAGLLAGTVARIQDYDRRQLKAALNDALIFVAAVKAGLPVLTANADFDLLSQLDPRGRIVFYRA